LGAKKGGLACEQWHGAGGGIAYHLASRQTVKLSTILQRLNLPVCNFYSNLINAKLLKKRFGAGVLGWRGILAKESVSYQEFQGSTNY